LGDQLGQVRGRDRVLRHVRGNDLRGQSEQFFSVRAIGHFGLSFGTLDSDMVFAVGKAISPTITTFHVSNWQ
jgi:hypothetical protein